MLSLEFLFSATVAVKFTTLYRFQKSINKRNTKVNGGLLKFTYFCAHSCPRSCSHQQHRLHFCLQNANLIRPLMLYRDSEKKL